MMTLKQASLYSNISKNGLRLAIIKGRLKATRLKEKWFISKENLQDYLKTRYSRSLSTYKGKLLYNKDKGEYSVNEVAEFWQCPKQEIYYALRKNYLPSIRKKSAWVIHVDDLKKYQPKRLKSKKIAKIKTKTFRIKKVHLRRLKCG